MGSTTPYKLFVFDQDGTLYLGENALPGAPEFVQHVRDSSALVRFVSNNPTKNQSQYVEVLRGLGFECQPDEVLTTVQATCLWLVQNRPGARVFPIAEQPLVNALVDYDIDITDDPSDIDIVISSYDRSFDYHKLQIAFDAIWGDSQAELIATNPDRYCPFPDGRGEPDCAAITAAIEACTGKKCSQVIGKPNPAMLLPTLHDLEVSPEETLVIGDRLHTDILLGANLGADTALVLTGDSRREDIFGSGLFPTYVTTSLGQLENLGIPG